MSNFFTSNDDIQFHFNSMLPLDEVFAWLSPLEKEAVAAENSDEYKKSWFQVLETLGEICGGVIANNAKRVEDEGLHLVNGEIKRPKALEENLVVLGEFGMGAYGVNPTYGGMGAPFFLEMMGAEIMNRACPSTMLNVGWYSSIAHIIELFGTDKLKDEYIPKIARAEISGSMSLTEPDAGSDLGALRAYAEKQADGSYKIFGTKRFITNGTSEITLVLAKNFKGAEGLGALSLFLCPKKIENSDNFVVSKLEEKVGLHGSATAELVFDGSVAWILGTEGQGFRYMLELMNDSRIGVGFQGIGLMEATYQLAWEYAQTRKTWDKPIARHELIAEKLLDLEVELKATRSLAYKAASFRSIAYAGQRYLDHNRDLSEDEKTKVKATVSKNLKKLRRVTPLIKYWVGEKSVVHARTAVQILGGYGFTTEYRAEWWVRESLIYALYEGTSQIQALMCVKDLMKGIVKDPKSFVEKGLVLKLKALKESDPLKKKLLKMQHMIVLSLGAVLLKIVKSNVKSSLSEHGNQDLFKMIKFVSRDLVKFENISPALLHAERLTEMECLVALSEALLEDCAKDASRRHLAERFINKAYLQIDHLKSTIELDEPTILARLKAVNA